MIDIIVIIILALITGSISFYLYRAKKRGNKCISCPYGGECGSKKCNCSGRL